MRPFLIVLSFTFAILSFTSCDQLKGLMGDKKAEEQKKLEEIASQMAQKMMEQQKKEAEEKAKQAQAIEAEVQKRLAALQAETQAQQAPQTQPTTQPTEKIIEKIIIKEKAPAEKKSEKLSGYVKLYEHKGNFGNSYTLSFGRNSPDTDHVLNDQRSTNFKDNCSSATYKIPAGWRVSLYEHTHYRGRAYTLTGSGSVSDLGFMNDKCSSVRWEN